MKNIIITANKYDRIPDPYGEHKLGVKLLALTSVGIAFEHPKRGICGMRFDSMTPEEKLRISTAIEL